MDQDVNPQTVDPATYDEHHPNMQPSTPLRPNPENEPSVFGPFGTTEWVDQLEAAFKRGDITSLGGQGQPQQGQPQHDQRAQTGEAQPEQGAQSKQLPQVAQALLKSADITSIRCTPQKLFVVQTKDGVTYESPSLRAALQQIPGLDLSQPFSLKGKQGASQQGASQQGASQQGASQQGAKTQTSQRAGTQQVGSSAQGSAQPGKNASATQAGGQQQTLKPDTASQSDLERPNLPPR